MNLSIVSGSANEPLAAEISRQLGRPLLPRTLHRFPDSELDLRLEQSVRGQDVYVVQPTSPPVDTNLAELLFVVDACRLAGAERVSAVVPYFGYARQDRRARAREPLGARLVAGLLAAAGVDRLVAIDLHSAAIEGCFAFPVEHLTAVPLLAKTLRPLASRRAVIVSPDLGAVKLAERYARELELPVAVVHKQRLSGSEVKAVGVIGEVADREPIVVDDMISTGATIEAAVVALRKAGARLPTIVVATHLLLVGNAAARIAALGSCRLVGSDSILSSQPPAAIETSLASVARLLSQAIYSLHCDRTITELVSHA
ncbi:MAG: ribose-phosphate diphosphokinase [Polyangia bacterium]